MTPDRKKEFTRQEDEFQEVAGFDIMEIMSELDEESNPDLLFNGDREDNHLVGLIDLGGTITKRTNELLTEKWLRNLKDVNLAERRSILDNANRIRQANRKRKRATTDITPIVARMYADLMKGIRKEDAEREAGRWVKEEGHRLLHPYSEKMVSLLRSGRIEPVLYTSAPYEIAGAFADHLGINELHATRLETDSEGRFNGEVEGNPILPIKKQIAEEILKQCRRVIFAIGNSTQDAPMFELAMHKMHGNDVAGRAILINPTTETHGEFSRTHSLALNHGKLEIINQGTDTEVVLGRIRGAIKDALMKLNKSE